MVFKDQNWGRKISDNTVGFITGLCLLRTRYQRCLSWIFTLPTDAWNEIQVYFEREKALIWCVVCRGFIRIHPIFFFLRLKVPLPYVAEKSISIHSAWSTHVLCFLFPHGLKLKYSAWVLRCGNCNAAIIVLGAEFFMVLYSL